MEAKESGTSGRRSHSEGMTLAEAINQLNQARDLHRKLSTAAQAVREQYLRAPFAPQETFASYNERLKPVVARATRLHEVSMRAFKRWERRRNTHDVVKQQHDALVALAGEAIL